MKNKYFFAFVLCLCIQITVSQNKSEQPPIKIKHKFDTDAIAWFKTKGYGVIKGTAKFKSKSGEIRYGDELWVELLPSCLYTKERLQGIYNNTNEGVVYIGSGIPKFTPDPKEFHDTKKAMCNKKGTFEYNNLPAGEYYVIAFMMWDKTGGGLMKRVLLAEGELKTIEMSNF